MQSEQLVTQFRITLKLLLFSLEVTRKLYHC